MTLESTLWSYIRDHVKGPDYVRVENSVGPGTPDVNYSYRGYEGWMELKYRSTFPRIGHAAFGDDGLNPGQRVWIRRRVELGGVVWIVAGVVEDVYFIPGYLSQTFNSMGLANLAQASHLKILRRDKQFSKKVLHLLSQHGPMLV